MPKIATRRLTGKNEVSYPFDVYNYPYDFSSEAGVYVISKRYEKDRKFYHTNLYVGITKDMQERHTDHEREQDFIDSGANAISFYSEFKEFEREYVEEDLLANGKKWSLNKQRK